MQHQSEPDPDTKQTFPLRFHWSGGWRSWLPIAIWALFVIGMFIHFDTFGGLFGRHARVDRVVTQAGRILVLRLPPRADGYQEQILVYQDSDTPDVTRGDVDMRGAATRFDDFEVALLIS